jgi:uncharacterized protein (TIGR03000 family)
MKLSVFHALAASAILSVCVNQVCAWGRGGAVAYRGGAVGYGGGAVAYRGGAVGYGGGAVAYRGGAVGYGGGAVTYRGGAVGYGGGAVAYRGGAVGYGGGAVAYRSATVGYGGGAVAYRGGAVAGYRTGAVGYGGGAVAGYRSGAVGYGGAVAVSGGHVGLATDFGFGHVTAVAGGRGFVAAGHYTTAYSGGVVAARGVAVRGGFYHCGAYGAGWWTAHPLAWRPVGWTSTSIWGWSTWPALTTWVGWPVAPIYYDFGNTIVYQGDRVYIDGEPGPTAAEYYQQATDLAVSAPPPPKQQEQKDDEWTPLGVFALVQGEQTNTDPAAVFQLAINKSGIIGGNYHNALTDTTLPVQGAADRKTQRASWIVGDLKGTVYDTGMYNLTKDQSPLLIHFGKERTQQWLLVRINEKDAKAPPPDTETAPDQPGPQDEAGVAHLTIVVPADAVVYFDGVETTQTGTERSFVTPPLREGQDYYYTIRARWTNNGVPVEQSRPITVKPNSRVRVDFPSSLP